MKEAEGNPVLDDLSRRPSCGRVASCSTYCTVLGGCGPRWPWRAGWVERGPELWRRHIGKGTLCVARSPRTSVELCLPHLHSCLLSNSVPCELLLLWPPHVLYPVSELRETGKLCLDFPSLCCGLGTPASKLGSSQSSPLFSFC